MRECRNDRGALKMSAALQDGCTTIPSCATVLTSENARARSMRLWGRLVLLPTFRKASAPPKAGKLNPTVEVMKPTTRFATMESTRRQEGIFQQCRGHLSRCVGTELRRHLQAIRENMGYFRFRKFPMENHLRLRQSLSRPRPF